MTVLFVRGINDKNKVTPHLTKDGKLGLEFDGSCSVFRYTDFSEQAAETVILFPPSANQPAIRLAKKPSLVFNEISDPDSHKTTLERCVKMCSALGVPVINHPANILRTSRDSVANLLGDVPGVKMPKTIRFKPRAPEDVFKQIAESGFDFPVIVRIAGVHGGKSNVFVESESDLHKLHIYPFDGSSFYLTQFVDYRSEDGLYRKYRIVVVDGEPMVRHLLMNSEWLIHAASQDFMEKRPELWDEEKDSYEKFESNLKPVIASSVREITKRLNLEYYGIDCNINEQGEILIFEVNANMNVFFNRNPAYEERLKRIKQAIKGLVKRKSSN